jgi:uncharacterized protein (DUF1330 family)
MAVNPTGKDLKRFVEEAPDEPVTMLNLLRFREDDGRDLYAAYLEHFREQSAAMGATVVYYGHGTTPLVAEDRQDWDAVLLVSYPSRRAFSDMVGNPEYQAGTHLRTEALVEAVLQPTVPIEF